MTTTKKAPSPREAMRSFRKLVRRFGPYLRPHRILIGGSMATMLLTVAFRALQPWPLKWVFDRVIIPTEDGSGFLASLEPRGLLALASVALVSIVLARAVGSYLSKVGFALIGNRVLTKVREDVFQHLNCLSPAFYGKRSSGDLVVRVVGDVGLLKEVAVTALMPLMASVLVLVLMIGLMVAIEWRLALVATATLPLYWLPTARMSKKIHSAAREQRRREGDIASTAAESVGAMDVVQAHSLADKFEAKFAAHNSGSLREGVKTKRLTARLEGSVLVLTGVSTAIVLWFGANLVLSGAITAGTLLVFLSYLKSAFKPMQDFAKYTGRLAKAVAAGERVLEILETEPDVADSPDAIAAPPFRGHIQFENVSFAYNSSTPVLRDVTVNIEPGNLVAIVGPSGSGKSTMVRLLLRLFNATDGSVRIDGCDVREYTLRSLRSQIGLVMQDNLLFATSIHENIEAGVVGLDRARITAAARLANADGFIRELPDGYDTVVGERGVTLSAGQRQRIAIARAAVRDTPILILDEPTSGLDEINRHEVFGAIRRLAAGRTTLFVTHDLSQARVADNILFLHGGKIVEYGPPEDLLEADGTFALWTSVREATESSAHGIVGEAV